MIKRIFNKQNQTIFIDKLDVVGKYQNKNVDIVISPYFYWIRIFDIPVDTTKEAIKLLPTLFEDIIPQDRVYKYYIKKIDEKRYMSVAYDNDLIVKTIKDLGIHTSKIKNIYLLQSILDTNYIHNNYTYIKENEIVIKIPLNLVDSLDFANIDDILKIDKKGIDTINISFFKSYLDNSIKNSIYALSIVLLSINIGQYLYFDQMIQTNSQTISHIKAKNDLPPTIIQTKSIIKHYQTIYKEQMKLRDTIKYILDIKSKFDTLVIKTLQVKTNSIVIQIDNRLNLDIKHYFKDYKILKYQNKNNTLTIKIKI
jgi:hypothetical protein